MEGIAEGWNADEQLQPACCSFQEIDSLVIRPAGNLHYWRFCPYFGTLKHKGASCRLYQISTRQHLTPFLLK
jgi:hypothetical protein